jgi:hypothetical protein
MSSQPYIGMLSCGISEIEIVKGVLCVILQFLFDQFYY